MKIIGNGLIAKSFKSYVIKDLIVVASGVSNSSEKRESEFNRELELIKSLKSCDKKNKIVYFSSASIYQEEITPYINHKLNVEKYIRNNIENYIIIRLPNVIGNAKNMTMIPFFIHCINENKIINIQKHAKRYFLHVSDIPRITSILVDNNFSGTINLVSEKSYSIKYVLDFICEKLKVEKKYKLINGGSYYDIPSSKLKKILKDDEIYSKSYLLKSIDKCINECEYTNI